MKSINEELFERIMRLPHDMRSQMMDEAMGDEGRFAGRPPMPPMGGHGRPMPMPHRPGMGEDAARTLPRHEGMDEGFARPMPFPGGRHHGMEAFPDHPPRRAPGPGMLNRERVLEVLAEGEADGMRQKDIANALRVNPSTMSEFIALLESNGYVTRRIDPNDRRATRIVLTEVGQARACELKDERDQRFAKLFANLTDDEKRQLIALLDKLMPRKLPEAPQGKAHLV